MTMADVMIPGVQDDRIAVDRQMTRLQGIADINDKMMDDPSLRSHERLERRR